MGRGLDAARALLVRPPAPSRLFLAGGRTRIFFPSNCRWSVVVARGVPGLGRGPRYALAVARFSRDALSEPTDPGGASPISRPSKSR